MNENDKSDRKKRLIIISFTIVFIIFIFAFFLVDNTDKKVMKYLNDKYDEEFINLKLIEKKETKVSTGISIDGSNFTKKKAGSYDYHYTVYSTKNNMTFDVYCTNDNKKYSFKDTYYKMCDDNIQNKYPSLKK